LTFNISYKLSELSLGGESNSVVVLVEVGIVFSDEAISKDEVVKLGGEVLSHDTKNALGIVTLGNCENVVAGKEGIISTVNLEGDVGKVTYATAVFIDSDAINKGCN